MYGIATPLLMQQYHFLLPDLLGYIIMVYSIVLEWYESLDFAINAYMYVTNTCMH